MRTNTVIIGHVLAAIAIGAVVYLIYDSNSEEITIECRSLTVPYAEKQGSTTVVQYTLEYTFTSKSGDSIMSDLPPMILTKGSNTVEVAISKLYESESGRTYTLRMSCPVGTDFGGYTGYLNDWSYHFELSDYMKREGNFKIIEATI